MPSPLAECKQDFRTYAEKLTDRHEASAAIRSIRLSDETVTRRTR
jgi:hypothetical protein